MAPTLVIAACETADVELATGTSVDEAELAKSRVVV